MKTRHASVLAALVVSTLATFPLEASSTFHPSSDEPGTITHVIAGQLSRAEREALNSIETQRVDPLWVYVGEEGGWELRPHSYDFRSGTFMHTDPFDHDTARPTLETQPENPSYTYLERG
jgi:hypothetical protein